MGSLLVVDGAGVCRAPIVAYTLGQAHDGDGWITGIETAVRGLAAENGRTVCENAAGWIGYSGPAIAYFGAYRAIRLSVAEIARADLVITAERAQRSAVVRLLPGTQASVFTLKEALVLARVVTDRRRPSHVRCTAPAASRLPPAGDGNGTVPLVPRPECGPLADRQRAHRRR